MTELRNNLSRYLARVRDGEEITVTDHGHPIARLIPLDHPRPLDQLIADGLVTPAPRPKERRGKPTLRATGPVSDLVSEQRR